MKEAEKVIYVQWRKRKKIYAKSLEEEMEEKELIKERGRLKVVAKKWLLLLLLLN